MWFVGDPTEEGCIMGSSFLEGKFYSVPSAGLSNDFQMKIILEESRVRGLCASPVLSVSETLLSP